MLVKNYFPGHHEPVEPDAAKEGAKVARYAWGKDYHNSGLKTPAKAAEENSVQKAAPGADARVL